MDKVTIAIWRRSGPCNDLEAEVEVPRDSIELVRSVLRAVNEVANDKEGWEMEVVLPPCRYCRGDETASACECVGEPALPRPMTVEEILDREG